MMDLPPPIPKQKKNSNWGLYIGLGLLAVIVAVLAGLFAFGVYKGYQRAVERKQAIAHMDQQLSIEQAKVADALRNGKSEDREAAVGRMKDELKRASEHMSDADAAAARGMASFMGKLQAQSRELHAAGQRLTAASVFEFKIEDRATIDENRKLLRDFLATNEKLTNIILHGEDLVGAELDAAGVPPKTRAAAIAGYLSTSVPNRPLMQTIRGCDKTIGETGLSVLDLLDQNWGKWHRNAEGKLIFQDHATVETFNGLMAKIHEASTQQKDAEQKAAARMQAQSASHSM